MDENNAPFAENINALTAPVTSMSTMDLKIIIKNPSL